MSIDMSGLNEVLREYIDSGGDPDVADEANRELDELLADHNKSIAQQTAIDLALAEAVKAIYLDDDSDYGPALWSIVKSLGGKDAADLLESDEEAAYQKYGGDK